MELSFDFSTGTLVLALVIFALRVFNYAISTLRLVFIARGMKVLSAVLAFVEGLIFAVVISQVVTDLSNLTTLLAYCLGAAGGSYLGMELEARLITSYSTVTIIARQAGTTIADALRDNNYGATVTHGEGRDGHVTIIRSSTVNKDLPALIDTVNGINSDAFIEVDATRTIRRGWLPGGPPHR